VAARGKLDADGKFATTVTVFRRVRTRRTVKSKFLLEAL